MKRSLCIMGKKRNRVGLVYIEIISKIISSLEFLGLLLKWLNKSIQGILDKKLVVRNYKGTIRGFYIITRILKAIIPIICPRLELKQ